MASMDTESSFQLAIVKGIDAKYNTRLRIVSELTQYHPSLRFSELKQSKNG